MNRLLQGDCLDVLPTLPAESVQCVVTSPPYYGLRDYGVAGQLGLEPSPQEFVDKLVAVFREVRRVLRRDGTCWLNLGDSYAGGTTGRNDADRDIGGRGGNKLGSGNPGNPSARKAPPGIKPKDLCMIPSRVALALQADGWWLRSEIIWSKAAPMPESVRDRPTCAHEKVFLLTRSERYFYDADAVAEPAEMTPQRRITPSALRKGIPGQPDHAGAKALRDEPSMEYATRNLRNVWHLNPEPFPGAHFATMPATLAERCIKAGTSEKGQCPHCGSPWVRQVERENNIPQTPRRAALAQAMRARNVTSGGHEKSTLGAGVGGDVPARSVITTGWPPSCPCPVHEPVPQTVLDPFAGAGTTLLVADRLQRHGIGIELNPAYGALARARIDGDAPLFAGEAA